MWANTLHVYITCGKQKQIQKKTTDQYLSTKNEKKNRNDILATLSSANCGIVKTDSICNAF